MITTVEERAAELHDVIRTCTLCALAATRTHAVPGEGPLTAEVMCIGEAPGMNEDKQGRPFVGAAGQFLGELLGAAGLTREQVYICNVLKCRPPGNRDPLPNEIDACAEYLDLQIDLVDPLVIVTLGRFSMSKWFPQQAISRIHGSVKEVDDRFVVPMYHPAAALHQGSLRQVLLDDFARLPAILERARARRLAAETEQQVPTAAEQSTEQPASEPIVPEPASASPVEAAAPLTAPFSTNGAHAASLPSTQDPVPERPASQEPERRPAAPPTQDSTPERDDPDPAGKTEQIRLFE